MEFFGKIKNKIKTKTILLGILFIVLGCLLIALALNTGFSTEATMQIGLRGTDAGIPIPDWLLSLVFILMGAGSIAYAVTSIISAVKNTDYNKLIAKVETIGDVAAIGDKLTAMQKVPLAKGDLRCDPTILFYMKGTDVNVVSPARIKAIRPEIKRVKNDTMYVVAVYTDDATIHIKATKTTIDLLANDMIARMRPEPAQATAAPTAQ